MTLDAWFDGSRVGTAGRGIGYFVDAEALQRYAAAYGAASKHLPAQRTESVVETAHGLVQAYRFGPERGESSVPLLLLSGRNAGTPSWAPSLPHLLTLERPIIALDSVGEAGRSAQTAPLNGPADQAAWVAESIGALGLNRVHLVAHSLGGWVATHVARHRPTVVASVTVLDPPATFTGLSLGFTAGGLAAAMLPMPAPLRRRVLGWIAGGSVAADTVSGSDDLEALGMAGLRTFRVRQPPPARPAAEDLRVDQVPSLAVFGARSRVHDADAAAHAAEGLGWRSEVWPDAGHTLHVDFPERLVALVGEHISQSAGGAGRASSA